MTTVTSEDEQQGAPPLYLLHRPVWQNYGAKMQLKQAAKGAFDSLTFRVNSFRWSEYFFSLSSGFCSDSVCSNAHRAE